MLKTRFFTAIIILTAASFTSAGEPVNHDKKIKELEKIIEDQGIYVETAKSGVTLTGYVDVSYTYNFNGGTTDSGINGSPEVDGVTGEDSNDFNVNEVRIILEKALPEENTWAAGFRIDLVAGEDFKGGFDNDQGLGAGGSAINFENAYVNFRVPVGNGLDFQFGKWAAFIGYEATARVANMNYTNGLLTSFMSPDTHTGIAMAYSLNDAVTLQLGLANGWDNSDSNFLDNNQDNGDNGPADFAKLITASIALAAPGGNAETMLGIAYSPDGEDAFGNVSNGTSDDSDTAQENAGLFALGWWGEWKPKAFKEKMQLAFNYNFLHAEDNLHHSLDGMDLDENSSTAWGLALYAKYQINSILSIATRAEYLHSSDGTLGFVDGLVRENENGHPSLDNNNVFVSNTDLWSWTATLGFDVIENLLLRIEYRLDVASSDGGGPQPGVAGVTEDNIFGNNQSSQHTIAINAAYLFW